MTYHPAIGESILAEAKRTTPHFVAHVCNFPDFDQTDVEDTARQLIDEQLIQAHLDFHYDNLCTIVFDLQDT